MRRLLWESLIEKVTAEPAQSGRKKGRMKVRAGEAPMCCVL
jgi:hypothetical protein